MNQKESTAAGDQDVVISVAVNLNGKDEDS